MDNNYQSYVNRVAQMTLPNNYSYQLKNIQKSPKFKDGKAVKFPGYTIITPPWEEENNNQEFYQQLSFSQTKLSENLGSKFFIPIPTSSFHLTLADLIWEENYLNAVAENPNFDLQLLEEIRLIFKNYQESLVDNNSLELELLGLSIFPRAITVCLVPTEASYQKIVDLQREIYQNKGIIKLGIEQQYNFTAHITLGYFGNINSNISVDKIQNLLMSLNDQWLENQPPIFFINQVELRKFEDMMIYKRQPDWPVIKFCKT
jgi:hypothetical protein